MWDAEYVSVSRDCTVAAVRHDRRSLTEWDRWKETRKSVAPRREAALASVWFPMKTWYVSCEFVKCISSEMTRVLTNPSSFFWRISGF